MSEARMRGAVVKALKPLHGIAVENPCLPGTPDVNYVEGWIELKWLRAWPKKSETPVRFDHYTTQQKVWAYLRRRAGGQCWFMMQCGREWLLIDGVVAAQIVNKATKVELIAASSAYFSAGLQDSDLLDFLQLRQPAFIPTKEEIARLRETT